VQIASTLSTVILLLQLLDKRTDEQLLSWRLGKLSSSSSRGGGGGGEEEEGGRTDEKSAGDKKPVSDEILMEKLLLTLPKNKRTHTNFFAAALPPNLHVKFLFHFGDLSASLYRTKFVLKPISKTSNSSNDGNQGNSIVTKVNPAKSCIGGTECVVVPICEANISNFNLGYAQSSLARRIEIEVGSASLFDMNTAENVSPLEGEKKQDGNGKEEDKKKAGEKILNVQRKNKRRKAVAYPYREILCFQRKEANQTSSSSSFSAAAFSFRILFPYHPASSSISRPPFSSKISSFSNPPFTNFSAFLYCKIASFDVIVLRQPFEELLRNAVVKNLPPLILE
jgi:hypothetical protein